jgi:hypothetical protein
MHMSHMNLKKGLKILLAVVITACVLVSVYYLKRQQERGRLYVLIVSGDSDGVSKMITAHPWLINTTLDSGGTNPLEEAVILNQEIICRILIKSGADVNALDEVRQTPIHLACEGTNVNIVGMLLQHGADLSIRDSNGRTPLFVAVGFDRTNTVLLLLKYGADPLTRDSLGMTPMNWVKKPDKINSAMEILEEAIAKATNK